MAECAAPIVLAAICAQAPPAADGQSPPPPVQSRRAQAAQIFAIADAAVQRGDLATAESAYRALAGDPALEVRSEARFRLGMMFAGLGRHSDAALLMRQILDEQPNAQRVRLELARLLDLIGDEAGARRALREAQAGGLPADVARFVDRYSAALRAQKSSGASLELAFAPDSNINRATRSDTLGTVIGDFTIDEDARQRSGVGIAARGQAYARLRVSDDVNLLARLSGAADLYRDSAFNDVALALSAGPELRLGRDRLAVEGNVTWRWFGGALHATTASLSVNYLRPIGRESQLRIVAAAGSIDNRRNALQDGESYSATLSYERALSSRTGVGASLGAERQDLRDPAYALTSGHVGLFGYRDVGAMTLIGTIGYGRLQADDRLFIYPRRRSDHLYRASLGATFRQLTIGRFAPLVRATYERNRSSIELFDYRRVRAEFGITRAF